MKKTIELYAISLASNKKGLRDCYKLGDRFFTSNGYVVLETPEPVPGLKVNESDYFTSLCAERMDEIFFDPDHSWECHSLPSAYEMRKNIQKLVGRKYDKVLWRGGEGWPLVNARYVRKILEYLHVSKMWIAEPYLPCYFYDHDDVTSDTKVMPCRNSNASVGYHLVGD